MKHKSKASKPLAELIEPLSTEFPLDKETRRLEYLTCFVGCGTRRIPFSLRLIALLVYLQNLLCHFAFEIYAYQHSGGPPWSLQERSLIAEHVGE